MGVVVVTQRRHDSALLLVDSNDRVDRKVHRRGKSNMSGSRMQSGRLRPTMVAIRSTLDAGMHFRGRADVGEIGSPAVDNDRIVLVVSYHGMRCVMIGLPRIVLAAIFLTVVTLGSIATDFEMIWKTAPGSFHGGGTPRPRAGDFGSMCAVSYEVGDRLEGYALTRRLSTGFGHATLIHCLALA